MMSPIVSMSQTLSGCNVPNTCCSSWFASCLICLPRTLQLLLAVCSRTVCSLSGSSAGTAGACVAGPVGSPSHADTSRSISCECSASELQGRGPFAYTLLVCNASICFLKEDVIVDRPVILCSCLGAPAAKWVDILVGPGWVVASDQHYPIAPLVDS